ncbi:MAG: FkbM family methyltransferase [Terriglobia bacterium]
MFYNEYGGYCVPVSSLHRPAVQAIMHGKVYEPDTISYMISKCGDMDIIHAGTFFGDFLPALANAIDPNSLIFAYEPNHESWRCAKITLELNEINNVKLMNAALGAQRGNAQLQTEGEMGVPLGGGSRVVGSHELVKSNLVNVVTIDETIPENRRIGILQLDVEGYEAEALSGALSTIRRCLPILILEVLPGTDVTQSAWFNANILALGYRYAFKLHGNSVYLCQADTKHS